MIIHLHGQDFTRNQAFKAQHLSQSHWDDEYKIYDYGIKLKKSRSR
jgi:hypothetical protein